MFIDTHAHLNFKAFNKNLEEVIDRAKKAGIDKIIIPGAKIGSSRKAVEISQKYDDCFAAIGIHPHHVDEFIDLGESNIEEELNLFIKNKKTVAIGEIGLDYHVYKDYSPVSRENKKHQKELLILQIEIATEFNLPIIFHCRDAHDDQLELIQSYIQTGEKNIKAVFHCFGGEKKHLEKVLNLGFYVGFDGNVTYPENKNLHDLVKYTPIDRLLLETDSPFLTPLPLRGKLNEPANLIHTVEFTSQIHNISIQELGSITTKNALELFKLTPYI
ncbi:TatD family hydrolase [Candidatus Gottesmanbacteria bacterium]|nr:TatD family hydrolase [Candidatus Gottesmanbacteria bacterium]